MVSSKITLAAIAVTALAVNASSTTEGNTLDVAERAVDLSSRHEPRDIDDDLVERRSFLGPINPGPFSLNRPINRRPLGHGPVVRPKPALAIARDLDENLEARFPHGGRPFGGRRPFGRGGPPPFRGMGNEARDLDDETLEARLALGGLRGGIGASRYRSPSFYRMPNQVRELDEDLEARMMIGRPFRGPGRVGPPPFYKMPNRARELDEGVEARFVRSTMPRKPFSMIAFRDLDDETLEARAVHTLRRPPSLQRPGGSRRLPWMSERSLGEEVLEEMERRGMELDELE